jgi:F0F1-type ATP synthase alpha subunit
MDVLLILDDMTTHARVYREISLLARRFPGRGSYPGDIFYLHAKLIERAGNFKKGSITALPVAESILGDLSGYIQTNLMSMTDGHIFFDIDLYNEGKRPAVNPYLSVTRIGHQTQTHLLKDLSRELTSFLVSYDTMKQFLHFGAEVGATAKNILLLGERIDVLFNQGTTSIIPINVNILSLGGLWAGIWNEIKLPDLKRELEQLVLNYQTDDAYKKKVNNLIENTNSFSVLVNLLRRQGEIITEKLNR